MKCLKNLLHKFCLLFCTPKSNNITQKLKIHHSTEIPSLKDLNQLGLNLKPVTDRIVNEENLIYASQLPAHVFPWALRLKGVYQVTFKPEILSQIKSGVLSTSGGVARNASGQIAAIGKSINPLLVSSPAILYQIGVIVCGSYYLQSINKSLNKINKKLDEISKFQYDKRSAQIDSYLQEFYHLSKGIIDFRQWGNKSEVLNRIKRMQDMRMQNLSLLLHLQQNIADQEDQLKNLNRSSLFKSTTEFHKLKNLIKDHIRNINDYQKSLLLDILLTKVEVNFSLFHSRTETESRLSAQEEQITFFKSKGESFERMLNKKIPSLIKKKWFLSESDIKKKRKELRSFWSPVKKQTSQFEEECKKHIQSTKSVINSGGQSVFYLAGRSKTHEYKKSA